MSDTTSDMLVLTRPDSPETVEPGVNDRLELRRLGEAWMVRAVKPRGRSPVAYLSIGVDPVFDVVAAAAIAGAGRGGSGRQLGRFDSSPYTGIVSSVLRAIVTRMTAVVTAMTSGLEVAAAAGLFGQALDHGRLVAKAHPTRPERPPS